jgi:hypothetical protein
MNKELIRDLLNDCDDFLRASAEADPLNTLNDITVPDEHFVEAMRKHRSATFSLMLALEEMLGEDTQPPTPATQE